MVSGAGRIRDVLVDVYDAMGFTWSPETTGSVVDEVGDVGFDAVTEALLEGFAARYTLEPAAIDQPTLARAGERRGSFLAPWRPSR